MSEPDPIRAHKHATANRAEIEASAWCGCIYCLAIFKPEAVEDWLADGTAFCPECQIDSVIGSASGLPITPEFLKEMQRLWFSDRTEDEPSPSILPDCLEELFPQFARRARDCDPEEVLPPASAAEMQELESRFGIPLPASYKALLACTRGFWLKGGVIQFALCHPFFHDFPPLDQLPPREQARLRWEGSPWPPPSQGLLCFADFSLEADGDQVLFDVSCGLSGGEYPVLYYAHESRPPETRPLADTFEGFMESCLDYFECR